MDNDFPAAHSTDTIWFAVDDAGHVAIFDSGEDGHVPSMAGDAEGFIDELRRHRRPKKWKTPLVCGELSARLGVFVYDYDTGEKWSFDPIAPYKRTSVPETPLHVDQLPPNLREQAKQARIEKVDFALQELVQPLEQYSCDYYLQGHRV